MGGSDFAGTFYFGGAMTLVNDVTSIQCVDHDGADKIQETHEIFVIFQTDAVANPGTMVIKLGYTNVTNGTMLRRS